MCALATSDIFFTVTDRYIPEILEQMVEVWAPFMNLTPAQVRNDFFQIYNALKDWWFLGNSSPTFSGINNWLQFNQYRDVNNILTDFALNRPHIGDVWENLMKAYYLA